MSELRKFVPKEARMAFAKGVLIFPLSLFGCQQPQNLNTVRSNPVTPATTAENGSGEIVILNAKEHPPDINPEDIINGIESGNFILLYYQLDKDISDSVTFQSNPSNPTNIKASQSFINHPEADLPEWVINAHFGQEEEKTPLTVTILKERNSTKEKPPSGGSVFVRKFIGISQESLHPLPKPQSDNITKYLPLTKEDCLHLLENQIKALDRYTTDTHSTNPLGLYSELYLQY